MESRANYCWRADHLCVALIFVKRRPALPFLAIFVAVVFRCVLRLHGASCGAASVHVCHGLLRSTIVPEREPLGVRAHHLVFHTSKYPQVRLGVCHSPLKRDPCVSTDAVLHVLHGFDLTTVQRGPQECRSWELGHVRCVQKQPHVAVRAILRIEALQSSCGDLQGHHAAKRLL